MQQDLPVDTESVRLYLKACGMRANKICVACIVSRAGKMNGGEWGFVRQVANVAALSGRTIKVKHVLVLDGYISPEQSATFNSVWAEAKQKEAARIKLAQPESECYDRAVDIVYSRRKRMRAELPPLDMSTLAQPETDWDSDIRGIPALPAVE